MKTLFKSLLLLGIALIVSKVPATAQTAGRFPALTGRVTDYAQLLSPYEAMQLTSVISGFEKRTTVEIAVVTLTTIRPETNINTYATAFANYHGIGKAAKNNGILLLVVQQDRELRLEVGLGLEKVISDEVAAHILDEQIIPLFKQDHYAEGILAGVTAVIQRLDQANATPAPNQSGRSESSEGRSESKAKHE